MKLKVEVVTTPNSNKKITESLLQLLSKYEKTIFETYFCGADSMRYGNPSPDLAVKIVVRESWFKEDCRSAGFVIE